jgi:hypothetical protein
MDVLEWKHIGIASDRCRGRGRKMYMTRGMVWNMFVILERELVEEKYYLTDLGQDEESYVYKKLLLVLMYVRFTH